MQKELRKKENKKRKKKNANNPQTGACLKLHGLQLNAPPQNGRFGEAFFVFFFFFSYSFAAAKRRFFKLRDHCQKIC